MTGIVYLDTLALRQRNPGLLLSDDEDIAQPGGEGVVNGVLHVHNVETTVVTLAVSDDTDTSHVATTSDHGDDTGIEADELADLAGGEVDLDGVVDTDGGIGIADGAGIVRDEVRDALLAELDTLDLAELVLGLGIGDTMNGEATLGVVDETEVLAGLLDRDDVHEAGGEGWVRADLAVHLDQALHDDSLDLAADRQHTDGRTKRGKQDVHTVR